MEFLIKKKIIDLIKLSFYWFFCLPFHLVIKGCTDPLSLAYDSGATKDDGSCTYPEDDKKTLIFYSTGTWCQYCGDIGKSFVDDISSDYPKSQIIALHKNDQLTSNMGSLIQSYLDSANGVMGCLIFMLD